MPNDRWEPALDQVLLLTMLLSRDTTESLARMGLTEARAHLVWELQARGPCTQRVLASALHVTPRAITAPVRGAPWRHSPSWAGPPGRPWPTGTANSPGTYSPA